jgi:hypothetical protein
LEPRLRFFGTARSTVTDVADDVGYCVNACEERQVAGCDPAQHESGGFDAICGTGERHGSQFYRRISSADAEKSPLPPHPRSR